MQTVTVELPVELYAQLQDVTSQLGKCLDVKGHDVDKDDSTMVASRDGDPAYFPRQKVPAGITPTVKSATPVVGSGMDTSKVKTSAFIDHDEKKSASSPYMKIVAAAEKASRPELRWGDPGYDSLYSQGLLGQVDPDGQNIERNAATVQKKGSAAVGQNKDKDKSFTQPTLKPPTTQGQSYDASLRLGDPGYIPPHLLWTLNDPNIKDKGDAKEASGADTGFAKATGQHAEKFLMPSRCKEGDLIDLEDDPPSVPTLMTSTASHTGPTGNKAVINTVQSKYSKAVEQKPGKGYVPSRLSQAPDNGSNRKDDVPSQTQASSSQFGRQIPDKPLTTPFMETFVKQGEPGKIRYDIPTLPTAPKHDKTAAEMAVGRNRSPLVGVPAKDVASNEQHLAPSMMDMDTFLSQYEDQILGKSHGRGLTGHKARARDTYRQTRNVNPADLADFSEVYDKDLYESLMGPGSFAIREAERAKVRAQNPKSSDLPIIATDSVDPDHQREAAKHDVLKSTHRVESLERSQPADDSWKRPLAPAKPARSVAPKQMKGYDSGRAAKAAKAFPTTLTTIECGRIKYLIDTDAQFKAAFIPCAVFRPEQLLQPVRPHPVTGPFCGQTESQMKDEAVARTEKHKRLFARIPEELQSVSPAKLLHAERKEKIEEVKAKERTKKRDEHGREILGEDAIFFKSETVPCGNVSKLTLELASYEQPPTIDLVDNVPSESSANEGAKVNTVPVTEPRNLWRWFNNVSIEHRPSEVQGLPNVLPDLFDENGVSFRVYDECFRHEPKAQINPYKEVVRWEDWMDEQVDRAINHPFLQDTTTHGFKSGQSPVSGMFEYDQSFAEDAQWADFHEAVYHYGPIPWHKVPSRVATDLESARFSYNRYQTSYSLLVDRSLTADGA